MTTPLTVDADELSMALEDHSLMMRDFLDLQTGEILFVSDDITPQDELERLDEEPDRYLYIEPLPSSEAFRIMEDFAGSQAAGPIQDNLTDALRRSHPFRRFKDALLPHPKIREEWFRFYDNAMDQIMREWLADNQVEAVLRRPTEENS